MGLIKFNTALIAFTATLGLSFGIISTSFADNPYALYINSAKKNYDTSQVHQSNDLQVQPESSTQKICDTLAQNKDDFINQMSVNTNSSNSKNLSNTQTKEQLLDKQKQVSDCVSS